MKCLIDPRVTVQHISNWNFDSVKKYYIPEFTDYENSARVCQVQEQSFEIAPPLFWVDCSNDVVADGFWYNTETQQISPVINQPEPSPQAAEDQPIVSGAQTL